MELGNEEGNSQNKPRLVRQPWNIKTLTVTRQMIRRTQQLASGTFCRPIQRKEQKAAKHLLVYG